MNKVYLLTYDLHYPGQNYHGLKQIIENNFNWWHYMESAWLLYTSLSANQIWNTISSVIDENDRVLIIEVTNNKQGWLTREAWDWINSRIQTRLYA